MIVQDEIFKLPEHIPSLNKSCLFCLQLKQLSVNAL